MAKDSRTILGLGNPLLDIIATCTEDFLKKYDLKADNAILATEKHDNLCGDMINNFEVQYLAGGAVQNSMRVAQWFFESPYVCTFFGCIGKDDFGQQMQKKAEEDRVNAIYMIDPKTATGTCACLITNNGKCRSLCAYLGASQSFKINHIHKNLDAVEKARIIYVSGFHLIVCLEAALFLAKHAHDNDGKVFCLNLSAPYISECYSEILLKILPYVDILFGNEAEALAFSKMQKWETTDIKTIAQKLADWENYRQRKVVITQGKEAVIVAHTKSSQIESYAVPQIPDKEIVDTNGAGDAFVGGYLAYLSSDKPTGDCINAAIYAAQEVIKQYGCVFPKHNKMLIKKP